MRVFLTGATGYIGSAVARTLARSGHEVLGLARSEDSAQKLLRMGVLPVPGEFERPMAFMRAAESADALIHAGFDHGADGARKDALAVETLLACACRSEARLLVYTSGVWVLGERRARPADETAEPSPPRVVEWRPALERAVLRASGHGLSTIVLRPGCVYGERRGLFGLMIRSILETRRVRLIKGGLNRWASVYLDDLAELYRLILEEPRAAGVYHATDGSSETVRETAEAFIEAAGGGDVEDAPLDEADEELGPFARALAMDQLVSSEKARRELGWKPSVVSPAKHARCLLEEWHEADIPLSVV